MNEGWRHQNIGGLRDVDIANYVGSQPDWTRGNWIDATNGARKGSLMGIIQSQHRKYNGLGYLKRGNSLLGLLIVRRKEEKNRVRGMLLDLIMKLDYRSWRTHANNVAHCDIGCANLPRKTENQRRRTSMNNVNDMYLPQQSWHRWEGNKFNSAERLLNESNFRKSLHVMSLTNLAKDIEQSLWWQCNTLADCGARSDVQNDVGPTWIKDVGLT